MICMVCSIQTIVIFFVMRFDLATSTKPTFKPEGCVWAAAGKKAVKPNRKNHVAGGIWPCKSIHIA